MTKKRYALVEIDGEWSDNDAMLELTWLPCAVHFHGLLDAVELQEVAARVAAEVMYDPDTTPAEMLRLAKATSCADLRDSKDLKAVYKALSRADDPVLTVEQVEQYARTATRQRRVLDEIAKLDPLPARLVNGPFLAAHEMRERERLRGAK